MAFGAIGRWKRYLKAREGATAVEFALIALPFFTLLFAIAEAACLFLMQTSLDVAVMDTSRLIRTGQANTWDAAAVRESVCDRANEFFPADCAHLFVDVETFDDVDEVANPSPLDGSGNLREGDMGVTPTGPDQIVVMRVFYRWELFTPFFSSAMANMAGQKRLLTSSLLFRNEPF